MKNIMKYLLLALFGVALVACHQPEEPQFMDGDSVGITSISARFADGPFSTNPNAIFTATVTDPAQTEIVVSIPWFFPTSSDNQITDITRMRIQAATEPGTVISPALNILDLTQPTKVDVELPNGRMKSYIIRGQIDKISDKNIESMTFVDVEGQRYDAIIDNDTRKIMVSSTEEAVYGCTITYRLSAHAKLLSPDLSEPMDITDGTTFVVEAHDGSTAEYEVKIMIPEKVDYGIRPASDKNVFFKYFATELGIQLPAGAITRLAVSGNNLILSTGSGLYAFDRFTGDFVAEIPVPAGLTIHSLVNDSAGNLLFAANAAFGSTFTVYRVKSLEDTPEAIITFNHVDIYSVSMGNLRVFGDVDNNAVVTAMVDTSQYFVAWQITGGVAGEAQWGAITPFVSTVWTPQGACVSPASDNFEEGLWAIGYAGAYDLYNYSPGTGAWSTCYVTGSAGNENFNCLSVVEFNKAKYLAFEVGAHFSYGDCPEVYMFDSSNPATLSNALTFKMEYTEVKGSFVGATGACSDVLLYVSPDGFKLSLYFIDGNYDVMGCYEFDCIKK